MKELPFDFEPQNPQEIDLAKLRKWVIMKSQFQLTNEQFDQIEIPFREKWNDSTGQFIGDQDFIQYIQASLQEEKEMMMLEMIEEVVGLLLDYLHVKGQYHSYYHDN